VQNEPHLSLSAKKQVEAIVQQMQSTSNISPLEIIELTEKDLDLIYSIAFTFYETGHYQKAHTLFTKLVLSSPFIPTYWKSLGSASQMLSKPKDALLNYGIASLLDPFDPLTHLYAAKVLIDLRRNEEAISALQKAESLAPNDDTEFHLQLKMLYERTSNSSAR
jgi:type III secretion system low calcium response chaperone LcrH/SycD